MDPYNTSQQCSGCGELVPKPWRNGSIGSSLRVGARPRPQRGHQHPSGLEEANDATGSSKPLASAVGYFTQPRGLQRLLSQAFWQ